MRCSALTLREIITDGKLEYEDRKLIRKPVFFFGDSIVTATTITSLMTITNGFIRLATDVSAVDVYSETNELGCGQVTAGGIYSKNHQSWCGSYR